MFIKLALVIGAISLIAVLSTSLMAQKIVKTDIDVHYKSRVDVSDDIIVFGTGFNNGVSYIKPGDAAANADS